MKKRLWEAGKSLLIALLICTLLLLTVAALPREMIRGTPWLSTVLQPLAPILGLPEAELAYVEDAQPVLDAAQPLSVSVRNSTGRYTAQWDFAALDAAYETLGGMLGQALDTAGEFQEVRADRLPKALALPSVCFDYGFSLDVRLLRSWLEASAGGGDTAGDRYVLAIEDGQVILYISGQTCRRAETEVSAEALAALLEQFKADGSQFAFEADSHLASLALIPGGDPAIEDAVSGSPCDNRYIETLATALGFNPYDENRYTDSAGVTYFSETNCSLEIAVSGEISLTSTSADRFQADGDTLEILVEQARSLTQLTVGGILGDARLYLSDVSQEDGVTVCSFDYVLGGVPVSCGGSPAAQVVFDGQSMTALRLLAVTFTGTGEALKVLPPTQAAAIAPAGSDLVLQYHRSASGDLSAGWAK